MRHQNKSITTGFMRVIIAAAFLFIIFPAANAETDGGESPANPVMAETGADGVQRLEITLDSYSFTPTYIIVQSGKPVEFTLKNVATLAPHNFRIDAAADGLSPDRDVAPGKAETYPAVGAHLRHALPEIRTIIFGSTERRPRPPGRPGGIVPGTSSTPARECRVPDS